MPKSVKSKETARTNSKKPTSITQSKSVVGSVATNSSTKKENTKQKEIKAGASTIENTPKRRGRPKGSKNKPKPQVKVETTKVYNDTKKDVPRLEACIRTAKWNVWQHEQWYEQGTSGPGALAIARKCLDRLEKRREAALER